MFKQDEVIRIIYQLVMAVNHFEKNGCILRFLDSKRITLSEDGVKIKNYIVDLLFQQDELKFIK
jgi:hypothetical protein